MNETWKKFIKYGSGFRLEAERDYHTRGKPLIFHLFMFGIAYPDEYELVGKNLEKLMRKAITDSDIFLVELRKKVSKMKE